MATAFSRTSGRHVEAYPPTLMTVSGSRALRHQVFESKSLFHRCLVQHKKGYCFVKDEEPSPDPILFVHLIPESKFVEVATMTLCFCDDLLHDPLLLISVPLCESCRV